MSKYLVTGGAGFIGSNIVAELVRRGEEVRVLDNLVTGKEANIAPYLDQIEFIRGDFTDWETAKQAAQGVDYVLHQGAIPSVPRSVADPIKTHEANVTGTLNMLLAAREAEAKRFVYAASSAAYGDSPVMPKIESMAPAPKSPYATQKLTSEYYCQNFYQLFGLETVCLRYFNVFGPNQDPASVYSAVIPIFIKQMLRGEAPTIYGSGAISRDFTHVANNVAANLLACSSAEAVAGEVINIASSVEISLDDLVTKINNLLGTKIKPRYEAGRPGDVAHSLGDITKAQKLLGYEVLVDFDVGLKQTIAFYKQN